MYISVEEDSEILFLENIEQLKFSQTTLDKIFCSNGKLREIPEIRVFIKASLVKKNIFKRFPAFLAY